MFREEIVLIDPEILPDVAAEVSEAASCVTLFNPLQAAALGDREILPKVVPSFREIRDEFDHLHAVIVDARREGLARFEVTGLDAHDVDLAAVLEVGFGPELHVSFAALFADLEPAKVTVLAQRPIFADIAATFFGRRGVACERSMVTPPSTAPRAARLEQLASAAQMANQWFRSDRRVYASVHRQTVPVIDELVKRGVAVGTPTLDSLLGLGLRRLARPDLERAMGVAERLRAYGAARLDGVIGEAWHSLMDFFEGRLPQTLARLETSLAALDVLQPDFLIAPAWGGVEAHILRAWARTAGVEFGVVQHGFNIGSFRCTRTRSVDADVFYAWSEPFARDWIDPSWNESVDIVTIGNPAHDSVTLRSPRTGNTVMLAPAGVLDFGRRSLLEFWETAFDLIGRRSDVRWKVRPHAHGRNNDWIRARVEELGAFWSRDTEPGLDDALADVDILVTMVSSVAIDAMVRGILVVLVNHMGEMSLFLPDVCAGYTTDRGEVAKMLDDLLDSPSARAKAYARQQVVVDQFATSGVAARVAEDIERRLRKR